MDKKDIMSYETVELDEQENAVGQAGKHRGDTPEQNAERAHPFPAEPVSEPPSDGNHQGIE